MIDTLNKKFAEVLSNHKEQCIDERMVKFKERSSMKQYIKSKSVKWGFKFWFRCSSKTGYFYQKDIYFGKKQNTEFNLGGEVVLQLPKDLHGSFCTVYYDIFFMLLKLLAKTENKCQKCLKIRK